MQNKNKGKMDEATNIMYSAQDRMRGEKRTKTTKTMGDDGRRWRTDGATVGASLTS